MSKEAEASSCKAVANLAGVNINCNAPAGHGEVHGNSVMQLIWAGAEGEN